jgi:hypothetical protein
MNEWEKHLLSWTPRRPSARLERRLFVSRRAPAESPQSFRLNWLAPVTAALAVMCVLLNQHYSASFPAATGVSPMVAMIMSNQSAPAFLPGNFQTEQNNLPVNAFGKARYRNVAIAPSSLSPSEGTARP